MDNMTALVSAFARAHHYKNNEEWVFADRLAEKMLTEEEYSAISRNMSQGISYFAPGFEGTGAAALRWIVEHQLAPSVLARSAFCERAIGEASERGCAQVVLFGCGYDTFSLRTERGDLTVFELDLPEMMEDRQRRIAAAGLEPACRTVQVGCDLADEGWNDALTEAGFDAEKSAFGALLGLSYYLSKDTFRRLLGSISRVWQKGCAICFDYPEAEDGSESRRNRELAAAAGEQMKAQYSRIEMEQLLGGAGFRSEEHLDSAEATEMFFRKYDSANPDHGMTAPAGVAYCLAVRQRQI